MFSQTELDRYISFHNNAAIKERCLERVRAHVEADRQRPKGCWVLGTGRVIPWTVNSKDHNACETELALPEWLARLEDELFGWMLPEAAYSFAVNLIDMIPVGVDLQPVRWQLCAHLMQQNIVMLSPLPIDYKIKEPVLAVCREAQSICEEAAVMGPFACSGWNGLDSLDIITTLRSIADAAMSAARAAESSASAIYVDGRVVDGRLNAMDWANWERRSLLRSASHAAFSAVRATENKAESAAKCLAMFTRSIVARAGVNMRSTSWSVHKRYGNELLELLSKQQHSTRSRV